MDLSKQRVLFIELMVWWKGFIRNKDLVEQFNISRQQAYIDLKKYGECYPSNLIRSDNLFCPSATFEKHHISGDVEQFLHWCTTGCVADNLKAQDSPIVSLSIPSRTVSVKVVRTLFQAIKQHKRIEADYVSLSNPEKDGRIFHPHTFVNTGMRWHIRGYCEKSQGFRDLVLSRFRDSTELLDDSYQCVSQDIAWQTYVSIVLKPDPRLSQQQQEVLALDYQLSDGQLKITTRAALANYVLQQMQITTKVLQGEPQAQQWIVVNLHDIKGWIF